MSRLIGGTYPVTSNIIPKDFNIDIECNFNDIYDMIDRASLLTSDKDKLFYNHFNKFLFIYDKELNKVFGLSLSTCRYLGCDTSGLLDKIANIPNNKIIGDFNCYPNEIKRKLQDNIHYMLPLYEYFSD